MTKANTLIYCAISKQDNDSYLKKQLEQLHCQLISITTNQVLSRLH